MSAGELTEKQGYFASVSSCLLSSRYQSDIFLSVVWVDLEEED